MKDEEKNPLWLRRRFIQTGTVAGLSGFLTPTMIWGNPRSKVVSDKSIPGKHPEMIILNDRPWNAETPAHLLNQEVTSMDRLFIRNNGLVPTEVNPEEWSLEISGESALRPEKFTLSQLKSEFKHHTLQLVLECAGNGRYEFDPPARGNQWTTGAVGAPTWTGIRLKDVLNRVGLKSNAVYIGYYGKDTHLSGDPNKVPISRGVPISKAMENESLIAWAANGEDLPLMHGYPLRLVFGGWPASTSGKWLTRIVVRDKVHDGEKMGGQSYRIPCKPVAPGSKVADEDMCIIHSMPVKSLITFPPSGPIINKNQVLEFGGHAWAGDNTVSFVEYSYDFGINWQRLNVDAPRNRFAWQHWRGELSFSNPGYYELWIRATDDKGSKQPMILPGWNPRGYLNNACHRIAIRVES